MGLYERLIEIRDEIDSWRNVSLREGLDIKMDRATDNYMETIEENCNYILSRSNYMAFKALGRYSKKKEKENGNKANRGFVQNIWHRP